jgi:hypothetical protein
MEIVFYFQEYLWHLNPHLIYTPHDTKLFDIYSDMIYIEQNALNKIFVDVSSATGFTPNFLWNLKNSQGMNVKNFIPRDITSTYPSQYAGKYRVFEFSTIPSLPENLTPTGSSVVNIVLPNLNQFWLTIYEQNDIVNLDPKNAVPVLNSLAFSYWDTSQEYYTGNTSNVADNVIYYSDGGIVLTPSPSTSPTPTPTSTSTPTPTPTPSSTPAPLNPEWNLGGGFDNGVYGMFDGFGFQPNSYYFTGAFNSYDGHLSPGVVKTDYNGNVDTNFVGKRTIASGVVYDMVFDPLTDTIVLGGTFLNYGGFVNANRMVRIDKNTGDVVGFTGTTFDANVFGFLPTQQSKIIVWGDFATYTGGSYRRIIRFNDDWSVDNTYWNASNNFNGNVNQVIENTNGNYVMVGVFTNYQGFTKNRIVEIDHTTGAPTSLFGTGSNFGLRDIKMDSLGNFYILSTSFGGTFNGQSYTSLAVIKVDSSGNLVPPATWGANQGSWNVAASNLYLDEVNGWIYLTGSQTDKVRRLDLATGDQDTTWGNQQQTIFGMAQYTAAKNVLVDYNTNKVLIGNNFYIFQGTPYNRLIRLNPDGTSNTTTT